ncbi:hypothetical protein RB195_011031 [Necator americanus]|uniref:Uncharacterized protein n=1 Tax=Necator americanus TaxID=51031 RepID=A0ABR1D2B9_NECAM
MRPFNSRQSPPDPRLQKSAGSMDPSHFDAWHMGIYTYIIWVSICQFLLLRQHQKEFLKDLLTEDESWVFYDSIAHRPVWLPGGEDSPKQAKSELYPKRFLLCCFWDSRGMLFYEPQPLRLQGHTGSIYVSQLQSLA